MADDNVQIKILYDSRDICPSAILPLHFNHPIVSIRVKNAPSEYRLRVNGYSSDIKSTNGVFIIADLISPVLKQIRHSAQGNENRHLTKEQNDCSMNFSVIDRATLEFDEPLDPTQSYKVSYETLRAYRNGNQIYAS